MIHHRLVLGNVPYTLEVGTDVEQLKRDIFDAVRRGGDWIRVPVHESAKALMDVAALVTTGLPVVFEAVTRIDEPHGEVHAGAAGPQAFVPVDDWFDEL